MKKFWMFCLSLCLSLPLIAQDITIANSTSAPSGEKKGYIAIMLGPSFPVGDYGDDDVLNNENAGMAKTGFSLFLVDFGYHFTDNFGVAASWFGGTNPVDESALESALYNNGLGEWAIESGSFSYGGLFVGPLFTLPLEGMDLDLRFVGGIASGFFPEIKAVTQTGSGFTQSNGSGTCFGYSLGLGTRVHLSPKISFIARFDYTGMEPEAEVETRYTSNLGLPDETSKVKQQMNTLSMNLGIAFRLK